MISSDCEPINHMDDVIGWLIKSVHNTPRSRNHSISSNPTPSWMRIGIEPKHSNPGSLTTRATRKTIRIGVRDAKCVAAFRCATSQQAAFNGSRRGTRIRCHPRILVPPKDFTRILVGTGRSRGIRPLATSGAYDPPAPLDWPASGDLGISVELRARRKPWRLLRYHGSYPVRDADRQSAATNSQLPPRAIRLQPSSGPIGSIADLSGATVCHSRQFKHHSNTLPCMSCNPHLFGVFLPTGCRRLSLFLRYHA